MRVYDLYLESGPRRRKTMVHVLDLLGCIANGPTTEDALKATPDAIRTYLRFLARCGEPVDAGAAFDTRVAEHITEGIWLGNGSPYVLFGPDVEPLDAGEIELLLRRFGCIRETLAAWAEAQTDANLDAAPESGGRTARAVLLHVLGPPGAYLAAVLGTLKGLSALRTAAERGELTLAGALRREGEMVTDAVRAASPQQHAAVIQRPKEVRTLRKAVRRVLEHDWEHLAELSRRPGGPAL